MGKLYFTCSFDDGDIADLRLASLLKKFEFEATFYVPKFCDLASKNLSDDQIRELAGLAEIGGHTMSHQVLTRTTLEQSRLEIYDCKKWLEDTTGKTIQAFCPPTGRFNRHHVSFQQEAGFRSMRTVEMLSWSLRKIDMIDEFVIMPTTTQIYNHTSRAYLRNIVKRLNFFNYPAFIKLFSPDWERMSVNYITYLNEKAHSGNHDYFFHLWGHSWEIEKYSFWESLENFFKLLSKMEGLVSCSNSELAEMTRAIKKR